MAIETVCTTPGAIFSVHIHPTCIDIHVVLPKEFVLSKAEAIQLDRTIHNALELALTPMFVKDRAERSTPMPDVPPPQWN